MQYEIELETGGHDAVTFCCAQLKDIWPDCVMQPADGRSPIRALSVDVFEDRRKRETAALFNIASSRLSIEVDGTTLRLHAASGAEPAAQHLARLPLWRHKVERTL